MILKLVIEQMPPMPMLKLRSEVLRLSSQWSIMYSCESVTQQWNLIVEGVHPAMILYLTLAYL